MSLRHPTKLTAEHFQHRLIVIDSVVLIVTPKLRAQQQPHLADANRQLMIEPETHFGRLHLIQPRGRHKDCRGREAPGHDQHLMQSPEGDTITLNVASWLYC
jgi:hypothetical protein